MSRIVVFACKKEYSRWENMRQIAIVEDDKNSSELLSEYLQRYSKAHGGKFETYKFYNVKDYLEQCRANYDIVFMDIELPDGNGMEAIRRIREAGVESLVIFVTNLAKYAVQGYEVKAFDFLVKPVGYYNFELKLSGALEYLDKNNDKDFLVKTKDGNVRLRGSDITYVEVMKHYLTYHTKSGDYVVLGSIGATAELLKDCCSFVFCNRCYLVNLKYVTQIRKSTVVVAGQELQISRQKRANFLKELNDYFGGGK